MSSITAAWAVGQGLNGREAAQTAAQKALSALGAPRRSRISGRRPRGSARRRR